MLSRYPTIVALILFVSQAAQAQHPKEMNPGFYVVVAAFSDYNESGTQKYTEALNSRGIKATYGFNSERNYYYVYLKHSANRQPSLQEMQETRKQPEFAKAWVRKVSPYRAVKTNPDAKSNPPEVKPVNTVRPEPILDSLQEEAFADTSVDITANEPIKPETFDAPPIDESTTEIFVNLFNATNNRTIEGKVKVVDPEKARMIKEVNGNDFLDLGNTRTNSNKVLLVCEAFGYRKLQQEINYPLQMADTAEQFIDMMGPTFIINFDLVRYNKGDIATLYEVFFYNDAAVMLPESKFELNSLLQMMQENPAYRVRLHGHTNGNYHGKILVRSDSKNFFTVDGVKRTTGSAKDLSEARAQIIKDYLVDNGIDESRLEIKAWGGKRPIYDKHGANAKKNVRVEVEILEDK